MAAKRGTRLILNARNEDALRRLCDEIREAGGEAYHVAGDVGGAGRMLAEAGHHLPRLTDKIIERRMTNQQQSDRPKPVNRPDSLYAPSVDGEERGRYPGHVSESSVYTKASVHPLITGSVIAGLGIAAFAAWRSFSDHKGEGRNSNYA